MSITKNFVSTLSVIAAFAASNLLGQTAQSATVVNKPTFIKGDLHIKYETRTQVESNGTPKEGVSDIYSFKINVSDSSVFKGSINHRPFIKNSFSSNQQSYLNYSVDCDIVNPANVAQTRNVGKFYGNVPIDENNAYRFSEGNLKASIFGIGAAKAFDSRFGGMALGKPPITTSIKESLNFFKSVGGKTVAVKVTNYDKMEFQSLIMASGPVSIYPEVTVNGTMFYDYGRNSWHLKNIGVGYVQDNKKVQDTLTGDIRWIEASNRKSTGEGEYVFDVRVNEPPPNENAVFAAATDESAFFATDDVNPSLTGSMKYKDSIIQDKVTSSVITIDLKGNKLSKQQIMYLYKLLFFTAIVPFNAE